MPEPVFYIRGLPRFGGEAGSAMVADLKLIAGLSAEQVERLAATLSQATGFLHTAALKELIDPIVSDDKSAKAVLRALQQLDPEAVEFALRSVDRRRASGKAAGLDDAKMANLRRNLSKLIVTYPALARFEKAERLSELTGQQLEAANLICDLRPIFDESGRNVEGMMPYTRLRVVATGADGLPREFEAELSVAQVYELFDSAKKAKAKLATLIALVETWLPDGLPDVPATRVPKGASE